MAKVELDIRAQIANLNKGLDKTEKQLKELQVQSTKTSKTIQGNMNKTNTTVTKLTSTLGAMFTIGAAVQFTKAIIAVRSEFEKYNAVLTTSLGSARAANREFEKIKTFAAETPFSVRELTDSFVRLVNQGFKPTTAELKRLGDLAASTGKDFIQLTEAIIDAQVGEFERLKEFGIRASKQGDQVTFTFKEVQTQVEFTADAIQEYILSLGDIEGVTGSMIAISKTLGGQINNLSDSWDNLLDTLGEKSGGVFTFVINRLTELLDHLDKFNELQKGITENSKEFTKEFIESLEGLSEEEKIAKATTEMNHFNEQYQILNDNVTLYTSLYSKEEIKQMQAVAVTYNAIRIALSEYIAEQNELIESREDVVEEIETIETLQKELKGLLKTRNELNIEDTEGLTVIGNRIRLLKEEIKQLEKLGELTKIKTPKAVDFTVSGEDDIFTLAKKENEKLEDEARRHTEEVLFITELRIAKELEMEEAAALEKRMLADGTTEAIISGLDLIAAADKDNAEIQQVAAIAKAIINGAVGITKTGAELGYPAAIPFQIALGLQTLAQIATIRQQKFEKGGYEVLSGKRHAQGGIPIAIGEGEDGEGHAVFSRRTTQKYGKFLPAFVKAIEEGKVDSSDPNNFNFFYDDSKQVTELKDIKQILSKTEIRYEKGYRIETRKGQRTKVKI